ncbi:Acyl-coenzyme A thioesterase 2, chloroplastic [Orobanche gracilis]
MEESKSWPSTPIPIFSNFTSLANKTDYSRNASPPSKNKKPLNLWPGMYHSPVTIALWETRSNIFERLLDPPLEAPPQTELLTKTPSRSRMNILYNFSTDYILREQYRDPWNEIRIGKLLEDLDALAGTISVKHCSDDDSTTRPLYVVTASVDKMVLKKAISVDVDLHISGAVSWVGHSSIEIQLDVTQPATGYTDLKLKENFPSEDAAEAAESIALTANFIFVARDYKTGKAAPVNRLTPETEREKLLYDAAESRSKLRKSKIRGDVKEIQNGGRNRYEPLLAEGRISCDMPALADRDSILLRDTRLENSLICQPQQRNIHGRIFGGFLMHRAFELAFSTVYAFAGMMPSFLEVDHVDFLRSVSNLLHKKAMEMNLGY